MVYNKNDINNGLNKCDVCTIHNLISTNCKNCCVDRIVVQNTTYKNNNKPKDRTKSITNFITITVADYDIYIKSGVHK